MIIHPLTEIQDVDRRILLARGVQFTGNEVMLPDETCSYPAEPGTGICSTSTREHGTIVLQLSEIRYLLPCDLEISYIVRTERDLHAGTLLLNEQTVKIPLEPEFIWRNVLNTDPTFREEYHDMLHSSLTGNWHNEEMNTLAAEEEGI
jgi:hypothetical protein